MKKTMGLWLVVIGVATFFVMDSCMVQGEIESEKTIRGPGSLGGWSGQGKVMYRVAHAGQMGYHTRTEYNKQIIKVGTNPEEINPKGGFVSYGLVRSQFILIKGSVSGARKRMIKLIKALRPKDKLFKEAPAIVTIIK